MLRKKFICQIKVHFLLQPFGSQNLNRYYFTRQNHWDINLAGNIVLPLRNYSSSISCFWIGGIEGVVHLTSVNNLAPTNSFFKLNWFQGVYGYIYIYKLMMRIPS
jgi:hypothetical protein